MLPSHLECPNGIKDTSGQKESKIQMKLKEQKNRILTKSTAQTRRYTAEETRDQKHAPITIVRRTPYSHYGVIEHELVALHRQLVCAGNEVDRVVVRKLLCDVGAE